MENKPIYIIVRNTMDVDYTEVDVFQMVCSTAESADAELVKLQKENPEEDYEILERIPT